MFALRLSVFLTLAAASSAFAQDQQSFTALQAAGFEVKSAETLTLDQTKRISPDTQSEGVIVTLQKGTQVSVCFFGLYSWVYMNKESLANATLCEVR